VPEFDFSELEVAADRHLQGGEPRKALAIYFYMADGDPSLDGGHLGERIATCYHALGDVHAAKYWYGRAIEENPNVNADCADRIRELGDLDITSFVDAPR
jgi:hypothetical protein